MSEKPKRPIPRWLCVITLQHRGQVGYILRSGPFWMCDRCGTVIR
jgi:hypothetical protein